MVKELWTAGEALRSGGVLAGLLAEGAAVAVSKYVSGVLFRGADGGAGARRPCM